MNFEWDQKKRLANVRKHGIDFLDAIEIFKGDTVMIEDDRFDYGERRFISLGMLKGTVIVVAHTEEADTIRIISARKATKNERKFYFETISD